MTSSTPPSSPQEPSPQQPPAPSRLLGKFLDIVERVGNKLPDPAFLFFGALVLAWIGAELAAGQTFESVNRKTKVIETVTVASQLTPESLISFMTGMVGRFMNFFPVGPVLVAMLGFGVAEKSGYINTGLRMALSITPKMLLTPMLAFVAIISHTAVDAGYVIVIPLGGVLFYAAGRHPVAGICAAFAGVSGGFSANVIPGAIDAILQGLTQVSAQVKDPTYEVNILCNYYFAIGSSVVIVLLIWFLTDRIIEPRVNRMMPVDHDAEAETLETISKRERNGFFAATAVLVAMLVGLLVLSLVEDSLLVADDPSTGAVKPAIEEMIVPLLFLLALAPGTIYGLMVGSIRSTQELIQGMVDAVKGLGHYFAIMFFAAQFLYVFVNSNVGGWLAKLGADGIQSMGLSAGVTIIAAILLTGFVNLLMGSASAKWGMLSVILVPLLMELGISPEYAQAAYRVGDSTTNIITPLMPYFPLVVVYCQKYCKATGVGTLISLMLPFSVVLLIGWTAFLLLYSATGIPLGVDGGYVYPPK